MNCTAKEYSRVDKVEESSKEWKTERVAGQYQRAPKKIKDPWMKNSGEL